MKMKIGTELPEGYVVSHENLVEAATSLVAHALLPLFTESMNEDVAKANVESIVTELAYFFDEGAIEIGGNTYRPRLAFVDQDGNSIRGASNLDTMHQMIEDIFDIAPEGMITFEDPHAEE
ncbi:hypothetical protein [Loktanella sp. S4079]|uniref:hypothetical protein n=1 Tax=Loktanella sp. S4079 TaxID=579483 RepID=UPI0005FA44C4|nr:hypothetical protein [Loktanella sp. S4079]KJZ20508.1 hypothetical protein TW80_06910 [Loktanella sp. S4079]